MNDYKHKMFAHCESGAVTAQLNHFGLQVSEPMVFGMSGGLFFGYFKLPSLDFPTFVLRNQPGKIRTAVQKRLGISINCQKNKKPEDAMAALDQVLEQNGPVAVQVDFFYMNYIPAYARAHFNAHFINVVGKKEDKYLVSDSYYPNIAELDRETLKIARSVKGPFAPGGFQFQVSNVNPEVDLTGAIKDGIKQTCFYMLRMPLPFMGVRGIKTFAKKVTTWPKLCRDIDHLSHEIMMIHVILEDRGTGGGGFRYLYASFLKESAALLQMEEMDQLAGEMMQNGDAWREISLYVARIGKQRDLGAERLDELKDMILQRAEVEKNLFSRLSKLAKRI